MKISLIFFLFFFCYRGSACVTSETINVNICVGQSYYFNGLNRTTTGTYLDTLTNVGGCDSFLTLNLLVSTTTSSFTLFDTICAGQSYYFNGQNRTIAGTYLDTLVNSLGCDSFLTLELYLKSISTSHLYDTICQNDSFLYNGIWQRLTGIYRDTFVNSVGCDSIVFLHLRVNTNSFRFLPIQTTCSNVPYVIGDSSFTTGGFKTAILTNTNGCDSIVNFFLTIYATNSTTLNRTLCQGQSFFFNGQNRTTSGIYLDTLKNRRNCDSFLTLNLTVYPVDTTKIDTAICDNQSYFFNNQYLKIGGTYRDTIKSSKNCDSFLVLNLSIKKTSKFTLYRKYCSNNPLFFNDKFLDTPGIYFDTLVNSVGCDSFLTMHLQKDIANYTSLYDSICSYDSFYFNNQYLKQAGIYYDTLRNKGGCDSLITLNLSIYPTHSLSVTKFNSPNVLISDQGFKYYQWYMNNSILSYKNNYYIEVSTSGNYFVRTIDTNNCAYTSNIYPFVYSGISQMIQNDIVIYPNPAKESLIISTDLLNKGSCNISVYSIDGKKICHIQSREKSNQFNLNISDLSKGTYWIEVENNQSLLKSKFTKE